MLGGAGICGALGYLLQKSADGKAEEAVEMRRTNTTPTNRLYKDLNENGGTRVAEIYGKTYVGFNSPSIIRNFTLSLSLSLSISLNL